jgi:hypothetical protein
MKGVQAEQDVALLQSKYKHLCICHRWLKVFRALLMRLQVMLLLLAHCMRKALTRDDLKLSNLLVEKSRPERVVALNGQYGLWRFDAAPVLPWHILERL